MCYLEQRKNDFAPALRMSRLAAVHRMSCLVVSIQRQDVFLDSPEQMNQPVVQNTNPIDLCATEIDAKQK